MSITFFEWEGNGQLAIPGIKSYIDNYGRGYINGVSVDTGVSYDEPLPPSCIKLVQSLVEKHGKNPKNCTMQPNRQYNEGYTIDKSFFMGLAEIQTVAKEIKSLKQDNQRDKRMDCLACFLNGYCDEPTCEKYVLSDIDKLKSEIKSLRTAYNQDKKLQQKEIQNLLKRNAELEAEIAFLKNLPPSLMESL
jgi:predicted RNase H-like nuclease (RuvC/YqgF family)